ncbi:hypothetical protein [Agrobacterium pusense]|uniref:hypothetical protein n=1 Tax=Agrobacterium pusense TaxID=648995 RepID=UPI000882E143|nr:hypothetical protein [Agrobacterium pusense]MBW9058312.1 hypothetical protein [Agrobacterium pusense]WKD45591.1 hypothetical protein M8C82_19615 [Agrobacterium pusense]SDF27735.1 hypothetical protein SAMN05421750_109199 [Agrobacterium pusense]
MWLKLTSLTGTEVMVNFHHVASMWANMQGTKICPIGDAEGFMVTQQLTWIKEKLGFPAA